MADEPLQEVDAPVEDQTDQALSAIALVVAEAINSQGERTDDSSPLVVAWLPIIRSTAGVVLLQYLMHTSEAFVSASGAPSALLGAQTRTVAQKATQEATQRAVESITNSLPGLVGLPPVDRAAQVRIDAGKVARAMVVAAKEEVRHELATNMGAVYKVWRTRMDAKVRPTHGDLEGNKIPLANKFVTANSNELRFPGDPLAPLDETAGCRCRLSYLVPTGATQ